MCATFDFLFVVVAVGATRGILHVLMLLRTFNATISDQSILVLEAI
jgi:hypothetical protein